MKKRSKIIKKIIIGIYSFISLLILIVFCFRSYMMLSVSSFYENSIKTFEIPGINDNLVQQGLCYDEKTEAFFVTGYIEKKASPIYIVNKNTQKVINKVILQEEDGSDFIKHTGGIALFKDYVYVAGGSECNLYVFSYEEIINAKQNEKIKALGSFSLFKNENDYLGPAFVTIQDNTLVVGEFYRKQNYPTLDTHKITTNSGDFNPALAISFSLDDNYEFNIDPNPIKAYSITSFVQGMCFANNKVYLSCSYGLAFSYIYGYDLSKVNANKEIEVLENKVPLYELDSSSLIRKYKIPPMSEEIVIVDDKMYIMCESASNKYIFGKFTSSSWCYALDVKSVFD